ncbi:MAG: L,D-transpeptidase [Parcubacteria group bacterium]|jgi:lipoprotein-anchoring transpeptidase ErfK/SrfK
MLRHHIGAHHINTPQKFILILAIIIAGVFGAVFSIRAYPEVFRTNITLERATDIRPEESVVVNFSFPVLTEKYGEGIRIVPSEKFSLRWKDSNKKLVIVPKDFWQPQMQYEIFLPAGQNIMFSNIEKQSLVFSTEKYPQVQKIIPENGAQDVLIDIEDPMIVNFSKSTVDFSLKFMLNSTGETFFETNFNRDEFKLMPKDGMKYAQIYHLEVYTKYKTAQDEQYEKIFESSFETAMPPKIIWDQDKNIRLEQAKRYTTAKIKTGKYIDINLSAQVMSIFEDGKILDSFMVSSGKKGMDTPKMETKIYNKSPRPFSKAYGLFMPNWMAMVPDGKYGIHELPEWPGGYKEGANHLGIPVSHGCVRLGVGSAKRVYDFAEVGTPVVIY